VRTGNDAGRFRNEPEASFSGQLRLIIFQPPDRSRTEMALNVQRLTFNVWRLGFGVWPAPAFIINIVIIEVGTLPVLTTHQMPHTLGTSNRRTSNPERRTPNALVC
jgi:hypothetical protein